MENFQFTQCYAFTLTINPKLFKSTIIHQLNCTARSLQSLFHHAKISTVIELTKNYNVHYHGIIQFHKAEMKDRTPEGYWYNKLRNHPTLGYSVLKVMDQEEGWKEYILKDLPRTLLELEKSYYNPIINDEHSLADAYGRMASDLKA